MRTSKCKPLLLALTAVVFPIWQVVTAPSRSVDNQYLRGTKVQELFRTEDGQARQQLQEVDLLALVFALSESLTKSEATMEKLEARVEKLEELTMDVAPDSPPRIFFGVENEGVKAFSWATNDAILVKSTEGYNAGVAYDSIRHKLYWSSSDRIYRGNRDDAEVEVVFSSDRYGVIRGLAHDWITGNLYGVSHNGIVFVCNTTLAEQLDCEVLLSGQGNLHTVTLNPTDGLMYWTDYIGQAILWAEMDGTGAAVLLSGLVRPVGITIDFDSSRLYWAAHDIREIKSSDLQGKDVRTHVTLGAGNNPWGVVTLQDRVYVGTSGYQTLQSITKAGKDVRTLYDGVNTVHQLVLATNNLPRNRTNHCEFYSCSRICVLTANYARCVNWN